MVKNHQHQQQQQQLHDHTNLPLISNARVIEYLVPTMSKGLLSMFPDNSTSTSTSPSSPCPDYDHSKSTIWSPLVPRHYVSSLVPYAGWNSRGCDFKKKKMKKKKRTSTSSEDGIPFSGKGWNKMMKAASRQFNKRKNSTVIMVKKLSNSKLDLLLT